MQTKEKFKKEIIKKIELDYLMYLPENYNEIEKWPLMLFLHGAGERGEDIEKVKRHGPPKLVDQGEEFPFIIVSPQCPDDVWWDAKMEDLHELLNVIKGKYSVDSDRIYLTGLSMGGYGTWELATRYPEEFAAIVPVCGGVMNKRSLPKIADTPNWVFHGEKDETIPVSESKDAVEILKKLGSGVRLTIYPQGGHDIHNETYENPGVYKWMLAQVKDSK